MNTCKECYFFIIGGVTKLNKKAAIKYAQHHGITEIERWFSDSHKNPIFLGKYVFINNVWKEEF